jgi:hypothetical protein
VLEGKGEGGSQRGGTIDQTPGCNPSPSQLGGAGLHYFGRETAEQLAAEGRSGRPRGQKRDQRAHRYWTDKTMRPLDWEAKTWVAALGKG